MTALIVSREWCQPQRGERRERSRQHFLYFTPLPQGQGELRPNFGRPRFLSRASAAARSPRFWQKTFESMRRLSPCARPRAPTLWTVPVWKSQFPLFVAPSTDGFTKANPEATYKKYLKVPYTYKD